MCSLDKILIGMRGSGLFDLLGKMLGSTSSQSHPISGGKRRFPSSARSSIFAQVSAVLLFSLIAATASAQHFRTNSNTNLSTNLSAVYVGGSNNLISSNAAAAFLGGGFSNTVSSRGSFSYIGGGYGNFDAGMLPGTGDKYGTIVGGLGNVLEQGAQGGFIGGGFWNVVRTNAVRGFIGGGGLNTIGVGGTNAVVVGGFRNTASGVASMIFGGFSNSATGPYSTVLGGFFNQASGAYSLAAGAVAGANHDVSFVWADGGTFFPTTTTNQFLIRASGGVGINTNVTTGNALTVRGNILVDGTITGTFNSMNANFSNLTLSGPILSTNSAIVLQPGGSAGLTISALGTNLGLVGRNLVAGHQSNSVSAGVVGATIAGGGGADTDSYFNRVTGDFGVVSGGLGNVAASYAFVGGGDRNTAGGLYATVAGGFFNNASGEHSVIPGGGGNAAAGNYSFAAGRQARALQNGTFVWADNQAADFESTSTNQFLIRASGGVGINTNDPGANALSVAGNAQITGALQLATIQVLTGSSNPTNNAPNGSLYLKTGAAANQTLWIRAENAWHPVTP